MRHPLARKAASYREIFQGRAAGVVLADLERFCHANSTVHVVGDTHGTAQLEGRRQVWLLMRGMLRLTEEQLDQMVATAIEQEGEE